MPYCPENSYDQARYERTVPGLQPGKSESSPSSLLSKTIGIKELVDEGEYNHAGCAGEDLGRIVFFGLTPELGELYRYSRSPSSFVKHKRINKNANQDDAST